MVIRYLTVLICATVVTSCFFWQRIVLNDSDPVPGKQIKLGGLYYYTERPSYKQEQNIHVVFLYKNKFILSNMYEAASGIPIGVFANKLHDSLFVSKLKGNRMNWGIFKVDSSKISYEKWMPKERRPTNVKTHIYTGSILSDTVFVIDSIYDNYLKKGRRIEERIYRFMPFEPKPDSTNNFIK